MKNLHTAGLFLKAFMLIVFYFWDVGMSSSDNAMTSQILRSEQIQPIPYRITNQLSDLEDFEHLEASIKRMMNRYNIKGASLAVAKDGQLVYAKGIGYADAEAGEQVEPRHLFRVASVSKLITAATIMKMTESGLFDIDDKVFGKEGILNDSIYLDYADPRIEKITVRHLLNHSAGWNNRFGDPLAMHHLIARRMDIDRSEVNVPVILSYVLKNRLHYEPGSRTSYSNLGYAILGEVIEAVSGMDYESYINQTILYPLGIHEMRVGRSLLEGRFENEVKYYGTSFSAYGGNDIETLGAAGGWIASPVELLKLAVAIDTIPGMSSLLKPETVELMTDLRLSEGHPLGWAGTDGRGNWWRTGTLTGTSALVMRQNDGLTWVVVFNSSTSRGISLPREINIEVQTALNKIENWPDHDLFYHFETMPYLYPDIAELR